MDQDVYVHPDGKNSSEMIRQVWEWAVGGCEEGGGRPSRHVPRGWSCPHRSPGVVLLPRYLQVLSLRPLVRRVQFAEVPLCIKQQWGGN